MSSNKENKNVVQNSESRSTRNLAIQKTVSLSHIEIKIDGQAYYVSGNLINGKVSVDLNEVERLKSLIVKSTGAFDYSKQMQLQKARTKGAHHQVLRDDDDKLYEFFTKKPLVRTRGTVYVKTLQRKKRGKIRTGKHLINLSVDQNAFKKQSETKEDKIVPDEARRLSNYAKKNVDASKKRVGILDSQLDEAKFDVESYSKGVSYILDSNEHNVKTMIKAINESL